MLKISTLLGAAASAGLATSAALGLGVDSQDASLKAAAHASAAVNAQIGNPDTIGNPDEFQGGVDIASDAEASAGVADPDDFDGEAGVEAGFDLGLGIHLGVD